VNKDHQIVLEVFCRLATSIIFLPTLDHIVATRQLCNNNLQCSFGYPQNSSPINVQWLELGYVVFQSARIDALFETCNLAIHFEVATRGC
jgi:hypothetical protein